MCGISGIVGQGWIREQLDSMVASQRHRGPDDSGTYVDDSKTVGLGHNRLSIIDLSSLGHQPMSNHNGTLWIAFNGEIYNYPELRSLLNKYPYKSQTDTEVILAAYEEWGESCVERFVGMFAFAIWDSKNQKLFCARDRLGIKPFHYAWHDNCFLFASEIKAILGAGLSAEPDWATWATYLNYGYYDHSEKTFFDKVSSLPPGHSLVLKDGAIHIRCYWNLPEIASETLRLDDDDAAGRFVELFKDSLQLRLRSDVPLGVNLSGGLDSASLLVMLDQLVEEGDERQTFTASFSDPRYDEQEFASKVPLRAAWKRNVKRLSADDLWATAQEMTLSQEAPYGGVSTLAYYHLHKLARDMGITVLLEGQGVDEMLGGYNYFRNHYYLDLLESGDGQGLRREWRNEYGEKPVDIDKIRSVGSGGGLPVYQDGTSHLSPECIAPEIKTVVKAAPKFPKPFKQNLQNALYRDLRYTKLPRVLRMNDRLSMAFGRELREPYLDHRIVEYLFRLPGHQKVRMGNGKFLLRRAMAGKLPDAICARGKQAVVTPQREWLSGHLRKDIEDILDSASFAQRGIFNVSEVKKTYARFCAGENDNSFFVWQWINTELWFKEFIDA